MSGDEEKNLRLSPQEKKRLSYEHDCRNAFGENDKASRKAIPLRKKIANRKVRHADKMAISSAEDWDILGPGRQKPDWRKSPDVPLAADLEKDSELSKSLWAMGKWHHNKWKSHLIKHRVKALKDREEK